MKHHIKIGVMGCMGRVGKNVVWEILSGHHEGVGLAGGTVRKGHPTEGQDLGTLMNQASCGVLTTSDPDLLTQVSDVVIDFTRPDSTARHAWLAAKHHTPFITGTTGLSEAQEQELHDAAKETAIVYAANMSLGVNFLLAFVEQMAERLGPDWDIEIAETHHRHKVDAPSGTALALGKAAAAARGEEHFVFDRTGERQRGTIGFSVQRGGDVVGEHTVSFFGDGERIELTHRAGNRGLFARGAIRAALWIKDQPHGLYSMRDVLGI